MDQTANKNNENVDSAQKVSESDKDHTKREYLFKHLIINSGSESVNNRKKRKTTDTPDMNQNASNKKATKMTDRSGTTAQKTRRTSTSSTIPTPLSNRFDGLPIEDDCESNSDTDMRTEKKQRAPAPIIMPGKINDHKQLVANIMKVAKTEFHLKYTANNVNVYFKNQNDKKAFMKIASNENLEYHTYTDVEEKTHAFVIRGLDTEPTPEEIKEEILKSYKLEALKVYRLRATSRPLYMVTFKSDVKLTFLQDRVKFIYYTKIAWERYRNKKIIIQCHRCQQWGHATSNCNRIPRCLKCAMKHLTNQCINKDIEIKCANCGEAHTANSITCPEYIRKLKERDRNIEERQRKQQSPNKYIPAPPPKTSVWTQRAQPNPRAPSVSDKVKAPNLAVTNTTTKPPPQNNNVTPPPQTNFMHTTTQIKELADECKTLNSLINLSNMLLLIRSLNVELSKCTNKAEKFTTTLTFMQNIDSYDI